MVAEEREQLEHRLVNAFSVGTAGLRVLCRREPGFDDLLEFVGRHARVRCSEQRHEALLAARQGARDVSGQDRLERLLRLPFWVLRRKLAHAIESEGELDVQRLLGPKRPVVVESRDALRYRDEILAWRRHSSDERKNGLLRCAFLPRGQRIDRLALDWRSGWWGGRSCDRQWCWRFWPSRLGRRRAGARHGEQQQRGIPDLQCRSAPDAHSFLQVAEPSQLRAR